MNEIIIRHVLPEDLIAYYEGLGFSHVGLSKSTHGGAEWHEMRLASQK